MPIPFREDWIVDLVLPSEKKTPASAVLSTLAIAFPMTMSFEDFPWMMTSSPAPLRIPAAMLSAETVAAASAVPTDVFDPPTTVRLDADSDRISPSFRIQSEPLPPSMPVAREITVSTPSAAEPPAKE